MGPKATFRFACLAGAAAVTLGAFGAHGLRASVTPERLEVFETATRYHFYHVLALLALSLATPALWDSRAFRSGAALIGLGTLVFSGSLYLLVLTDTGWLGAITPIGGGALIAGWLALAVCRFPTREAP